MTDELNCHYIISLMRRCRRIVRNESGARRRQLLSDYLRLKLRQFVRTPHSHTTFLGYSISFSNYNTLVFLVEEIFIDRAYDFVSQLDSPVVFDCGGNIGIATLFFKWLYPGAIVTVFEPDPTAFSLLRRNVAVNKLRDVRLINAALLDHEGEVQLFYDPAKPAAVTTSTVRARAPQAVRIVPAVKLSDYICGEHAVDFVKLDIEGVEGLILSELDTSGKLKFVKQLAIEENHDQKQDRHSFSHLLATLENSGFRYQLSAGMLWYGGDVPDDQNILIRAVRIE